MILRQRRDPPTTGVILDAEAAGTSPQPSQRQAGNSQAETPPAAPPAATSFEACRRRNPNRWRFGARFLAGARRPARNPSRRQCSAAASSRRRLPPAEESQPVAVPAAEPQPMAVPEVGAQAAVPAAEPQPVAALRGVSAQPVAAPAAEPRRLNAGGGGSLGGIVAGAVAVVPVRGLVPVFITVRRCSNCSVVAKISTWCRPWRRRRMKAPWS